MNMIFPHGDGDYYHKYRPRNFDEILGHSAIVSSIREMLGKPGSSRTLFLHGASGTGKTTVARIIAMAVNCGNISNGNPCGECVSCKSIISGRNIDIQEINAAEAKGIDEIRRIKDNLLLAPMQATNKVFILDESQALTRDAQQSVLKILEEVPANVFIILCSTEPKKLLPTVLNRCQKFNFQPLSLSYIIDLLNQVCTFESIVPDKKVLEHIAEASCGSPRGALVYLQQVVQAKMVEHVTDGLFDILSVADDTDAAAIDLCLLFMKNPKWSLVVTTYKKIVVPPEVTRLTILGFFKSCLLSAKNENLANKYSKIMDIFIAPFYDVKPENNLVNCLYKSFKVINGKV